MTKLPPSIDRIPRALTLPRALRPRTLRWLIWLVPALAVAIVAGLAARALWQRGPTVTITFATAEGLEAHRTTIKYKSVDIGVIRSIELLDDRSGVVVTAELTRKAEGLLVEDARFWVVRPRVSTAGVSGIGTLLTGAHIGFDAGVSQERRHEFVGLEAPPSTISDRKGRRFVLRADNIGSLDIGSPLYLRRLQVGQVTSVALDADARSVILEIFVDAPHDRHVTTNTRFWNASGVDLTVSARGIKLDTQSLASVLLGGIAFETPSDGLAAPAGAEFELFAARDVALRSAADPYALVFHRPLRGLAAGATVELMGLDVGEVSRVSVDFDPETAASRTVVTIAVYPERLPGGAHRALIDRLVERGLRAQVRTENIITGQRYVALEVVPGARRARVDWSGEPVELPTAEGRADDLPSAVTRLVAKLEKVPLAELAQEGTLAARQMRQTFEETSRMIHRVDTELAPQLVAVMGQAQKTMGSVEQTLSSESPLQQDLRGALRDLSGAGYALRSLAEYLERHPESLIRGKKEDRP